MPTLEQQINRIQSLLQDTDETAFSRTEILTQHQDEMDRITRERRMGDIIVLQGVADQSLYAMPDITFEPRMVLYDGSRLDFATEEFLDRRSSQWEFDGSLEPKYWTVNNQNPETIRVAPTPARTGSNLPIIPPNPFTRTMTDNLVIFRYRSFRGDANDESDLLPLMDTYEDVLVWRTAAELARRETEYQNLALSQVAYAMGELWLRGIDS